MLSDFVMFLVAEFVLVFGEVVRPPLEVTQVSVGGQQDLESLGAQ